jgi:hypothetical protein
MKQVKQGKTSRRLKDCFAGRLERGLGGGDVKVEAEAEEGDVIGVVL